MSEIKSYAGAYIGKDTMLGYTLSVYRSDGTSAHFVRYNGKWCFVTTGTGYAEGNKLFTKVIPCLATDKINNANATIFWGDKLLYDNSGTRANDYPEYYINAEELKGLSFNGLTDNMPEVPVEFTNILDDLYVFGEPIIRGYEGCEKTAGAYAGRDKAGVITLSIYNDHGDSGHFIKHGDKFFMKYIGTFSLLGNNDMTTRVAVVATPDNKRVGKAFFERQRKITHKISGVWEPEYTEYHLFTGDLKDFCKHLNISFPYKPDGTIPEEWQQPLETLWNIAMTKPEINPPISAEEQHGDVLLYVTAVSDSKSLDDYSDKANYFCFVGITASGKVIPLSASVRKDPKDVDAWTFALEELKKQDGSEIINFVYEAWSGASDAIAALAKVYPNAKGYDKAYLIPSDTPFKQKISDIKYKVTNEVKKTMSTGPFATLADIETRAKAFVTESKATFAEL